MSYKIQILSDEEFEKLPYEEVSISLGLADTNTNTAYVRYVANEGLQRYLINHELEHLIGEDRDEIHHDGKGIYYKGFGNVFSALGQGASNIASGIGSAAGQFGMNAGQALGGAARSIGGGISNLAGSLSKATGFGGGFQGGANPSGGLAAAAASNPALRAPMNYFGGSSAALGASNPSFRMPTSPGSIGGLSSLGQRLGQTASGSFSPQGMTSPSITSSQGNSPQINYQTENKSQTPNQQPQTQQSGGGMFGQFGGKLMSGFGDLATNKIMSMFGSATGMTSMPRMPDISELPSVQALKNFDFRGNMGELDPSLQEALNRDFDRIDAQEQHDFRNRWKNVRPGADIENDSVFARDYQAMQQSQATRRADAMAKYRFEMISTNLGINKMEYDRLQDMAQLDVDTISYNTGMSAIEAMNLKKMFGFGTATEGTNETATGMTGGILPQSPSMGGS